MQSAVIIGCLLDTWRHTPYIASRSILYELLLSLSDPLPRRVPEPADHDRREVRPEQLEGEGALVQRPRLVPC